jgi:hypothetical protein
MRDAVELAEVPQLFEAWLAGRPVAERSRRLLWPWRSGRIRRRAACALGPRPVTANSPQATELLYLSVGGPVLNGGPLRAATPRTSPVCPLLRRCGRLARPASDNRNGRGAGPVRRARATPASVVMEKRGEPSPGALDRGGSPATSSLRGRGTESMAAGAQRRDSVALPAGAHRRSVRSRSIATERPVPWADRLTRTTRRQPRRHCHSTVVLQRAARQRGQNCPIVCQRFSRRSR